MGPKKSMMNTTTRLSERGSARLKFIIVMGIIAVVAYVAYLFIPITYQSYLFRDLMQHNVDVAVSQGYDAAWVKNQLSKSGPEYGIPEDAIISPALRDYRMEVRVQFTKPIIFPGYTYNYDFDHTVKSTTFLTFK